MSAPPSAGRVDVPEARTHHRAMSGKAHSAKSWSKGSPANAPAIWDYVVIGSGMGGMTAAAILAKLGRRVLVIEQHYVPGGFTHMFKRPGYTWDVGVHAVGEVTERSLPGRILARLTDGKLKWQSLGGVYDEFHFPENFRIDFPDSPQKFRANLLAAFPREEEAIDRYFDLIREVSSGMRGYYLSRLAPRRLGAITDFAFARRAQKHLESNTREVVEGLTQDLRLRTIFTAQWGYYGSPPSRSSFAMQALVVKHFLHGGFYPVGGSRAIANTLLATVAAAGGWTRVATEVEQIIVEEGRAAGVRLSGGEVVRAHHVVSAAGVMSTVRRLLPQVEHDQEWAQSVGKLSPAPAHVCLYIGFKGDIRKAGAGAANKWFWNTWDAEAEAWDVRNPDALPDAPVLYCSFPSLKDPEHDPGPEVHHTGEVVTFVPWEVFAPWKDTHWKKRGAEYDAMKEKLKRHLLEQFLTKMPLLRPLVDFVELSTPLSTDNFCRPVAGSIYGIEPTPERFKNQWLRPRAPVKNLYFAGSEVASVGVIGTMMGGVLAATAAEPVGAFGFLR